VRAGRNREGSLFCVRVVSELEVLSVYCRREKKRRKRSTLILTTCVRGAEEDRVTEDSVGDCLQVSSSP
jgi:hypothetical protein